MFQHLAFEERGPLRVVTVSRPDVRNAMGKQTWDELDKALSLVEAAPDCRALVLTAAGSDFIAGGDLKELQHVTTQPQTEAFANWAKAVLNRLSDLPVPVIAAVEGHAIGGGCEIALACDMRIAGEGARFSFWEIKNAVTTGWGGGRRLLGLTGPAIALELLLTGDTIGSDRAREIGLVNHVVPDGQALATALALGERIAAQPPLAVRAFKSLLRGLEGRSRAEADALETEHAVRTWLSVDHTEAVRSFLERRPPAWQGR